MKNRRDFLKGLAVLPILGLVSACKPATDYSVCADESGLTPEQKQIRSSLGYVNVSADPAKPCSTCKLYVGPKTEGGCGGCTVMAGQVSPLGSCKSWIAA